MDTDKTTLLPTRIMEIITMHADKKVDLIYATSFSYALAQARKLWKEKYNTNTHVVKDKKLFSEGNNVVFEFKPFLIDGLPPLYIIF